jgi:predicted SAM-dependent methyltransferase
MRLNLGACNRHFDGFISVDIYPPADVIADLSQTWPWTDSSVDAVKAFDIFEHLPVKRHTLNELWRVLKPGARAEIEVPTIRGVGAVCDPTHCSYWSAGDYARERFRNYYGIKADFRIVQGPNQSCYHNRFEEEVWKVGITLEAVK